MLYLSLCMRSHSGRRKREEEKERERGVPSSAIKHRKDLASLFHNYTSITYHSSHRRTIVRRRSTSLWTWARWCRSCVLALVPWSLDTTNMPWSPGSSLAFYISELAKSPKSNSLAIGKSHQPSKSFLTCSARKSISRITRGKIILFKKCFLKILYRIARIRNKKIPNFYPRIFA